MPFESPQGHEFEDFEDCVATVEEWDDVDDPEALCGAWQSEAKQNVGVIRYNNVDPTDTAEIRQSFQRDLVDRWDGVVDRVQEWLDGVTAPIDYDRLRLRLRSVVERAIEEEVLEQPTDEQINNGRHWTATQVRLAYQRGLRHAEYDLEQIGTSQYEIRQATRLRAEHHQKRLTREYQTAYLELETQLHAAMDRLADVMRTAVGDSHSTEWIAEQFEEAVESEIHNRAKAHGNTVVVEAVNEALLTSYEAAGVEQVGYAAESDAGSATVTNAVRFRVNQPRTTDEVFGDASSLPDPDDPTSPDEVQWVTAGDDAVCQECHALEGTVLSIEAVRGNDQFQPPIHPNCRCRLIPVMGDGDGSDSTVYDHDQRIDERHDGLRDAIEPDTDASTVAMRAEWNDEDRARVLEAVRDDYDVSEDTQEQFVEDMFSWKSPYESAGDRDRFMEKMAAAHENFDPEDEYQRFARGITEVSQARYDAVYGGTVNGTSREAYIGLPEWHAKDIRSAMNDPDETYTARALENVTTNQELAETAKFGEWTATLEIDTDDIRAAPDLIMDNPHSFEQELFLPGGERDGSQFIDVEHHSPYE